MATGVNRLIVSQNVYDTNYTHKKISTQWANGNT